MGSQPTGEQQPSAQVTDQQAPQHAPQQAPQQAYQQAPQQAYQQAPQQGYQHPPQGVSSGHLPPQAPYPYPPPQHRQTPPQMMSPAPNAPRPHLGSHQGDGEQSALPMIIIVLYFALAPLVWSGINSLFTALIESSSHLEIANYYRVANVLMSLVDAATISFAVVMYVKQRSMRTICFGILGLGFAIKFIIMFWSGLSG